MKTVSLSLVLASVLVLSSCTKTWVVRRDLEGGVIGYSGFSDQGEASQKISALIDCPNGYFGVSDEMKAADYQYTTYETVNSQTSTTGYYGRSGYGGHQQTSTTVPVTRTATKTWREFSYKCKPASASAQMPGTGLGQQSQQTQNSGIQPGAE